jgi:DNA invertase Pin-like site-specific DNA recombinase
MHWGLVMLTVLGGVAKWERAIMLERQREGIAKAREEGKYKGRHPSARNKAAEVILLAADGMKRDDIAIQLEISIASVYRILAALKAKPVAPLNS